MRETMLGLPQRSVSVVPACEFLLIVGSCAETERCTSVGGRSQTLRNGPTVTAEQHNADVILLSVLLALVAAYLEAILCGVCYRLRLRLDLAPSRVMASRTSLT
jgi:hypothetical protein